MRPPSSSDGRRLAYRLRLPGSLSDRRSLTRLRRVTSRPARVAKAYRALIRTVRKMVLAAHAPSATLATERAVAMPGSILLDTSNVTPSVNPLRARLTAERAAVRLRLIEDVLVAPSARKTNLASRSTVQLTPERAAARLHRIEEALAGPAPRKTSPASRPAVKLTPEAAAKRLRLIEEALAGPTITPLPASEVVSSSLSVPYPTSTTVGANAISGVSACEDRNVVQAATKGPPLIQATIPFDPSTTLNKDQQAVVNAVLGGKNVFFTGSAGCGKSLVLREIVRLLRRRHRKEPHAVAITASTGIAACNVGGVTLQSYAGIGSGQAGFDQLLRHIRWNAKAVRRWRETKVLVIEEISMVDGMLFDKLCYIARALRRDTSGFGGIQLVVCGDFFQLPPVSTNGLASRFAFEGATWDTVIDQTFVLKKVYRQKDPSFVQMLDDARVGRLSKATVARFHSLSRAIDWGDGIEPTELFPRRADVDAANAGRLGRLSGQSFTYTAVDRTTMQNADALEKLMAGVIAPHSLVLKVGAQVMLLKNMGDGKLVNGSMGIVSAFCTWPQYLAQAQDAQAVSGVLKSPPASDSTPYPLVRFTLLDQLRGRTELREVFVSPETWQVTGPTGESLASRKQVPLQLAWAMSIHKSQGQTLQRVRVDLGRIFETGQAYVALSRATHLDKLQVVNFKPDNVRANSRVLRWYDALNHPAGSA